MAENTGMTCRFIRLDNPLPQGGGRDRLNYHLDRMAENTGMTRLFNTNYEKGTGGRPSADVHLDRLAAHLVAMNGDPVVESVDLAEACNAAATTPAATPDLVTGQAKALSPTLDNAPILHITPLTSANSTF